MSVLVLMLLPLALVMSWPQEEVPRMGVDYLNLHSEDVKSFKGVQIDSGDHWRLLQRNGSYLLIGAKNRVYNISVHDLKENLEHRIDWNSREKDIATCMVKGKKRNDCNNYIRVLAQTQDDKILVCGTNSYTPRCRYYIQGENGVYQAEHEMQGIGYCPFNPEDNSTFLFTGGKLYSGAISDFSGSDALIIKDMIRTEQYNMKHLNGPNFVGSIEDEDFVYFFFREAAVEYMNCGKKVYSRVARVCKGDKGSKHKMWTTYLKARLNCSVPGMYPFYFNEIQSIFQVDDRIFAVFNTPDNSISGSAVCSYNMADVYHAFEGNFKVQKRSDANWLPGTPNFRNRPGVCRNDTKPLPSEHLSFLRNNMLMDTAVPSTLNLPHFVKASPYERLTSVAVDPEVRTTDGKLVDILLVGTTRGRILRMASFSNGGIPQTNLIEDIQLFPYHVAVSNILLVADSAGGQGASLVALSQQEIKSVPVQRCGDEAIQSCQDCVAIQDPYCAWDVEAEECVYHSASDRNTSALLQNINTGIHMGCPQSSEDELERNRINYEPVNYFKDGLYNTLPKEIPPFHGMERGVYSLQTFVVGSLFSITLSLLFGFGLGFFVSRKYTKEHSYLKCGHAYLEAQALDRSKMDTSHYTEPHSSSSPSTKKNLLGNIPEKRAIQKGNVNGSTSGTVGMSQKIYI